MRSKAQHPRKCGPWVRQCPIKSSSPHPASSRASARIDNWLKDRSLYMLWARCRIESSFQVRTARGRGRDCRKGWKRSRRTTACDASWARCICWHADFDSSRISWLGRSRRLILNQAAGLGVMAASLATSFAVCQADNWAAAHAHAQALAILVSCSSLRLGSAPLLAANNSCQLALPSANRSATSIASRLAECGIQSQIKRQHATANNRNLRSLAIPRTNSSIGFGLLQASRVQSHSVVTQLCAQLHGWIDFVALAE